jgi:hypothetical protein
VSDAKVEAPLRIVRGDELSDTIGAAPTEALVVQVTNAKGKRQSGVEVLFDATSPNSLMLVQTVGETSPGTTATALTDNDGRAAALVRFGERAGAGFIVISVPVEGVADTATYTVLPGGAFRAEVAPRDTLVDRGATFAIRTTVFDRGGNVRSDPVVYEATSAALGVDAAGIVTAANYGSGFIRVRPSAESTARADSLAVAVIADARIASTGDYDGPLTVTHLLSGNQQHVIDSAVHAPWWAPGADEFVINRGGAIWRVMLGGAISQIPTLGLENATWPEYSSDGDWIYFHGTDTTDRHIFRMRPDGTERTNLTPNGSGSMPSPSPDGSRVAYVQGFDYGPLMVLDLASGVSSPVPGVSFASSPRWSPDGQWIAFVTGRPGNLGVVRPDGSGRRLMPGVLLDPGISWSPDSRWIIGYVGPGYLIDASSGTAVRVEATGRYPTWRR